MFVQIYSTTICVKYLSVKQSLNPQTEAHVPTVEIKVLVVVVFFSFFFLNTKTDYKL